jgi:hypothetical protein
VGEQSEGGYWSENYGPVVVYNFVYADALGTYYALSGDDCVLPALEKAAIFHYHFRYPNGELVETIDERNPYHGRRDAGNVGFSMTRLGRLYLEEQWDRVGWDKLSADLIASFLLYGKEGLLPCPPGHEAQEPFILREGGEARAAVLRDGPWFACLSAYVTEVPKSRWIQDRQNLVSVYHDKVGLIIGGGNTKLQPAWSTFTAGDTNLLRHKPGDTKPDFLPKGELYHVPSKAVLVQKPKVGLDLMYGRETCRIRAHAKDGSTLEYVMEAMLNSELPVVAHVTLLPRMGKPIETAAGEKATLGDGPLDWSAERVGGWIMHGGYRLRLPPSASVHWPALPHNPYRKDGHAKPAEGRIEIRIPFDRENLKQVLTIEVAG